MRAHPTLLAAGPFNPGCRNSSGLCDAEWTRDPGQFFVSFVRFCGYPFIGSPVSSLVSVMRFVASLHGTRDFTIYSARRAPAGFTRVARSPGSRAAANPIASSRAATTPNTIGSRGETP
jgi:hypothetical protein